MTNLMTICLDVFENLIGAGFSYDEAFHKACEGLNDTECFKLSRLIPDPE